MARLESCACVEEVIAGSQLMWPIKQIGILGSEWDKTTITDLAATNSVWCKYPVT
jgi:hypothetical protein